MMRDPYVQGFTIIEAVVSMVITAIVLAIIFVIFSITTERLYDFRNQNEDIADLNRMMYSIQKSIFDNERMVLNDNELMFYGSTGETTKYLISEKFFVRLNNDFADTFNISVSRVRLDTLPNKTNTVLFQRLKWIVTNNGKDVGLNFYKRLYADQLLNSSTYEY